MVARIFKPAKSAMQSGRSKDHWTIAFDQADRRSIDPLMGYTGSGDMQGQLKLTFETKEDAIAYCTRAGIAYRVHDTKERKIRRVSYAENFKFGRQVPWTH